MATKKQKRAAVAERRARFEAELQRTNREALNKERQRRRRDHLNEWQDQHDKKHSWKKRIKECPHCQIEIRAAEKAASESVAV